MSRIIVKNIPLNATPESLRTHLSSTKNQAPIITDVHIARKPDGTPRRFAFVGFKTEEQALAAQKWWNNTFWGSQKIFVEIVQGVKDAPAPRPNKRPRLEGPEDKPALTPSEKNQKSTKPARPEKNKEKNDIAEEFLALNRRKKGPSWADGPVVDLSAQVQATNLESQPTSSPSKLLKTLGSEGQEDTPRNDAVSDLEWMKARMSSGIREVKEFEQSDDEQDHPVDDATKDDAITDSQPLNPAETTRQTILSTDRLFIRNLTFSCTSEELHELFGRYGQIDQVHIPLTPEHTSKGIAFVSFTNPADAVAAWESLDGTSFQGRLIHIIAGVERRKGAPDPQDRKKSLKDERAEKRKKDAGKSFSWGMLYMNSDAVASSIADRMNIPKADILGASESEGVSSQSPAVKLALAETHIIQETKRYFEEQGVVLETLAARSVPRSRTIILVKNIPYGTSSETLRDLFEPNGEISRILMPPSGTLAVVEFVHVEEAGRAFRSVAYRRLGNSIIYLEWAPEGLLTESSGRQTASASVKPVTVPEQEGVPVTTEEQHASIRSGSTLFIKNLSFATTSDRLAQVFRNLSGFSFARVQMKPASAKVQAKNHPEQKQSMGYGFVGFSDVDSAKKATKSMQGFVLDGHKLLVSFAGRGADDEEKKDGAIPKSKTTKMIVKNVPFEATKQDLKGLFGVYGTLKSVRLPKKIDSRTRGFAFLEFVSRHEAENAFAALRHTHLLGRHLVLDWAQEGEQDIEVLRKKVGVGYGGGTEMPGKKRKLDMALDGGDEEEE